MTDTVSCGEPLAELKAALADANRALQRLLHPPCGAAETRKRQRADGATAGGGERRESGGSAARDSEGDGTGEETFPLHEHVSFSKPALSLLKRLQPRLRSLCGDDDVVLNLESEAGEKLEAFSESLHEQAKELILLGAPGEGAVGAVAHTLTMVEPFVLPREHPAGCKDELDTVTRWGMRAVTDLSPGTLLGMYLGDYATGEELDAYQAAQKKNQIRVLRRLEEAREHCIAGPIPKRSAEEDMVILDCLLELPHKLRIGKNEDDSLMVNAAPQPGPDGHRAKTIGALYNDARGFQPRRRPNCVFISAVRGRDVPCGLGAPEGMHLPLLFVVVCEDMVAGEECLINYGGARYWKRLEEMCAVKQAVIQLERGEKVRANPLFYKRKIRKLFEDDKWYDGEVRGSGTRYECVSLAPPPPHPLRDELNTPHSSWYRVYYHADAATEDMSLSELLEVLEDE